MCPIYDSETVTGDYAVLHYIYLFFQDLEGIGANNARTHTHANAHVEAPPLIQQI